MWRWTWGGLLIGVGCGDGSEVAAEPLTDDLFFVEMVPPPMAEVCESELTHNFEGARAAGGPSILFREVTDLVSASAGYAYVTRRGADELVLNFEGTVYVGEFVDGDTIDVQWQSSSEENTRVEFQESYRFNGLESRTIVEQLTLTREAEMLTGTMTVLDTEEVDFVETDEWNTQKTGVPSSGFQAGRYLEFVSGQGFVRNQPDAADCDTGDCQLVATDACSATLEVTAWPVEGGLEAFEALVGFERAAGIPFGTP